MLAEGVLGGGGAARVLAAVSQHALVAAAASAVVKQGRLAHGWRKLPAQHAAVGTRMKMAFKTKKENSFDFWLVCLQTGPPKDHTLLAWS